MYLYNGAIFVLNCWWMRQSRWDEDPIYHNRMESKPIHSICSIELCVLNLLVPSVLNSAIFSYYYLVHSLGSWARKCVYCKTYRTLVVSNRIDNIVVVGVIAFDVCACVRVCEYCCEEEGLNSIGFWCIWSERRCKRRFHTFTIPSRTHESTTEKYTEATIITAEPTAYLLQ